MKLVKEIEIIINDLLENDQPSVEIARQVLALIRTKNIGDIDDRESLIITIQKMKKEYEDLEERMNKRTLNTGKLEKEFDDERDRNESLQIENEHYKETLTRYADMIVVDSEDRPHDVGMLARDVLSKFLDWPKGSERERR